MKKTNTTKKAVKKAKFIGDLRTPEQKRFQAKVERIAAEQADKAAASLPPANWMEAHEAKKAALPETLVDVIKNASTKTPKAFVAAIEKALDNPAPAPTKAERRATAAAQVKAGKAAKKAADDEAKIEAKAKKNLAAKKAAKATKAAPAKKPTGKGATVLALIARKQGASLEELMHATGWQAHSVRGFLSTANKKGLATITSATNAEGQRIYRAS